MFDCQKCGACCYKHIRAENDDHHWVHVSATDTLHVSDPQMIPASRLVEGASDRDQWMRMVPVKPHVVVCVALAIDTAGVRCTVYGQRPSVCQYFQVGGEECLKARALHGL